MGVFIKKRVFKKVNKEINTLLVDKTPEIKQENGIPIWTNKSYMKGNLVMNNGELYECVSSHNSFIYDNYGRKKFIDKYVRYGVESVLWIKLCLNKNISQVFISEKESISKKYAITIVLDNNFSKHFYVFLNSFLENNTWFDGDLIILYNDELSPLSEEKIFEIKFLYRNILFKKIEHDRYIDIIKIFKSKVNQSFHRFIPSILTIEIFNLKNYDKVLYLDTDTIVLKNICQLFTLKGNIIATRDTSSYIKENYIKKIGEIEPLMNGGFLLLDGNFIKSDKHVDNMLDIFPSLKNPTFLDQSLFNEYFKNYEVLFISSDFNVLKRCFDDTKKHELNKALDDIKIIHYVGEKPWNEKQKDFEKKYKEIEKLWFNYYNRYKYICEKIDNITLLSSGINSNQLIDIKNIVKNSKIATTNWGIKYKNIIDIDFYYCSTVDNTLIDEINYNKFKPNNLWLLTNNVQKLIHKNNEMFNNIEPFNFICSRLDEYNIMTNKRTYNKKIPLPTSGVSMLLFFSTLNIKTLNLVGYNLYTKKNEDGSYKEHGSSKFINPYNDKTKPHSFEFDLNFIIIALKKIIKNKTNINFYESKIIEDVYNLINNNFSVDEIITEIKLKYYE